MTKLVNVQPGDGLGDASYFRASFEPLLPKQLVINGSGIASNLYTALYSGIPYLTPINTSEWIPGQTLVVFDVRIFPEGAALTVAQLARDLNSSKFSTSLFSLERVDESRVYGDVGRAERASTQASAQGESDSESIAQKLANIIDRLGWVLLILLALVAAAIGWKIYRAVPL